MNKIKFIAILILQLLFFVKLFSQIQNNPFIIAWYDHSGITATIATMAQNYKDMQEHNINCAITPFNHLP